MKKWYRFSPQNGCFSVWCTGLVIFFFGLFNLNLYLIRSIYATYQVEIVSLLKRFMESIYKKTTTKRTPSCCKLIFYTIMTIFVYRSLHPGLVISTARALYADSYCEFVAGLTSKFLLRYF